MSPSDTNILIDAIRRLMNIDGWEVNSSMAGISIKGNRNEESYQQVSVDVEIPPHGVFYLKGGYGINNIISSAITFDDTPDVEVICTTYTGIKPDAQSLVDVIGTHRPYLVNYDDTKGVPAMGDRLGVDINTFSVTKGKTGLVATSDPDTTNKRIWVVKDTTAKELTLLQLVTSLVPGSIAQATIIKQEDGDWEVGDACFIQDVQYRSFGVIGDLIWAVLTGTTQSGLPVYEAVGENGLEQSGITAEDIECGDIGEFSILVGSPDKDVDLLDITISDKDSNTYFTLREALTDDSGTCATSSAGVTVEACGRDGFTRRVFAGETVRLKYDVCARRWRFYPVPELLFAIGSSPDDICANTDFTISSLQIVGACNGITLPTTNTGKNPLNLKAKAGMSLYLQFDGIDRWLLVNVEHISKEVVDRVYFDPEYCQFFKGVHEIATQTCKDPEDVESLGAFETATVVEGFEAELEESGSGADPNKICNVRPKYREVAVLCKSPDTTVGDPLFRFTQVTVLFDIIDTGDDIVGYWKSFYVIDCGIVDSEGVLLQTDPCVEPYDSGSGSGG